jgi:hypothetical protein
MTIEGKGRWLFGVNAVINWVVSVRRIVDPAGFQTLRSARRVPHQPAARGRDFSSLYAGLKPPLFHRDSSVPLCRSLP